jgi:selenocysteine-specific elongation factor
MEKHITVGVAGHVDHGKTSLVRCLTRTDTDRLKEEKQRGLSIEPGIAQLLLPSGKMVALVDVPGHSDYLKNTIRGLSSVDMAILVVAADDGVMPQTLDHLEVLNFVKAKSGIVVLSKADLVDDETLELAELEIREVLAGKFLEGKPVIPFSAMEEIKEKVREKILQEGSLTLQGSKEVLGYGRTRGVAVLEHLDSIGLTYRVGDERFLRADHSSRFCPPCEPSDETGSGEAQPETLDQCS